MDNIEKYILVRDQFLDLLVAHYKLLGDIEKSDDDIAEMREYIKDDIDSVVDELGVEEAILYVEDLIEHKEDFLEMSEEIYKGTYDFTKLIDEKVKDSMGVKIGDVLLREDDEKEIVCKVVGFSHLKLPIVEFLRVNVKVEKPVELVYYSEGEVKPYPYMDFYEDLF